MQVAIMGSAPGLFGTVARALQDEGVVTRVVADVPELLALDAETLALVEVLYAPGYMAIGEDVLAALPKLNGLVSPFTGIEGFDRAAAAARGILIANGQIDENVESMAEATVLMLLAAAYQLPASIAVMANGGWPRPAARGRMLKAMTVGLIGYGRIAQEVAARLAPFGCRLVVYAPRLRVSLSPGVELLPLDDLAEQSDAIVVLASLSPESWHLIDARLMARMKADAIVVNVARGGLIDEAALIEAARAGKFGWLALDVFETEPLPADSPLRDLPRTMLTPHAIGHTRETIARLPLHALDNIRHFLRGEQPLSVANPEALPLWRARITEPRQ